MSQTNIELFAQGFADRERTSQRSCASCWAPDCELTTGERREQVGMPELGQAGDRSAA